MSIGITNRLINFIISGCPFDDKKKKDKKTKEDGEVFESKNDYINKVTEFLETGIKEIKKDIKGL